jgi:hypothetical protein
MQGRTGEQKHVRNFREENCKRKTLLGKSRRRWGYCPNRGLRKQFVRKGTGSQPCAVVVRLDFFS